MRGCMKGIRRRQSQKLREISVHSLTGVIRQTRAEVTRVVRVGSVFDILQKKNSLSQLFSIDFSWRFSFYVHQKVQNEMNKFCRLLSGARVRKLNGCDCKKKISARIKVSF